jgi:hypothetical protein
MKIITRDEWEAAFGSGYPTDGAKTLVVAHHDGPYPSRSQPGMSQDKEASVVRMIEHYHVRGEPGVPGLTRASPRIGYSFIIMQTGRVYEGCGWGRIGAHTGGMNSSSYGVFFPLAGNRDAPTVEAVAAFHDLRADGVRLGHLSRSHLVKGHQDFNKPACPGRLVYDAIVLGVSVSVVPTVKDIIKAHPSLREGKGGLYGTAAEREAVRHLQRLLRLPDEFRTGYFGKVTLQAVLAFQRRAGLLTDGIVGPKTWRALEQSQ